MNSGSSDQNAKGKDNLINVLIVLTVLVICVAFFYPYKHETSGWTGNILCVLMTSAFVLPVALLLFGKPYWKNKQEPPKEEKEEKKNL